MELLQVQVDVMRIRRKLGILRNKIEKGENLAARELEEQVALEFQSWDEKLKYEHARINEAKARFSSLPSLEDAEEIHKGMLSCGWRKHSVLMVEDIET